VGAVSTRRPKLSLALPALLTALVVAACGSSGGSSSSSSAAKAAAASATSSRQSTAAASPGAGSTSTAASSASAAASSTSSTTPSAGAAAVGGCPTSSLRLSFVSGQGAAGTAYMTYALTNVGSSPCTLFGYPGVSILGGAGQIVQHPAQRGGIQAPTRVKVVTLSRGGQARFLVTSSDVIPSPGCPHAFTGTTLQVFPPNQRQALTVPRGGQFCNLHVGPVEAPQ
jgi:Protein of unknown function (DUF4232)